MEYVERLVYSDAGGNFSRWRLYSGSFAKCFVEINIEHLRIAAEWPKLWRMISATLSPTLKVAFRLKEGSFDQTAGRTEGGR